jgi:hypothetical protein
VDNVIFLGGALGVSGRAHESSHGCAPAHVDDPEVVWVSQPDGAFRRAH